MTDPIRTAITRAVAAAIKAVGLSGVRNMSMFPSAGKKKEPIK